MKINLKNGHIMVKEIIREEKESETSSGIILPGQQLEDEQASTAKVVRSDTDEFPEGCTVLFHKVLPIDVNMRLDGDKDLQLYFFINTRDIICSITE